MHRLCAEIEVHACQGAARQALGARSRPRRDAGAVRPLAQDHAHPTPDRRTSIRNHQGVDGRDPLQAAHPRKGQRGDEPSRSRLQSEADDRHLRGAANSRCIRPKLPVSPTAVQSQREELPRTTPRQAFASNCGSSIHGYRFFRAFRNGSRKRSAAAAPGVSAS